MAADLDAVHRALAAQIDAYIDDDWNVSAYPNAGMEFPAIEVWPGSPYADHAKTFGATGHAELQVEVRLFLDGANAETVFKRVTRALSVGTGHGSSVIDAINSDRTLDGTAETLVVGPADWEPDGLSAVISVPVAILVRKSGAQP